MRVRKRRNGREKRKERKEKIKKRRRGSGRKKGCRKENETVAGERRNRRKGMKMKKELDGKR